MHKTAAASALAALALSASPALALGVGIDASVRARGDFKAASTSADLKVRASATATSTRLENAISRADKEIARRIESLTDISARVQAMTKISDAMKSSLAASVSAEIAHLNALKAQIDAQTDFTALKNDINSITSSYRIYMLVIPVGRIEVAADKVNTVVGSYTVLAAKLQTRITGAQTAGKDVTALNASLGDMKAKTADAQAQATAAVSLVANLKPDNGDESIMRANTAAIKSARAKIQTALADLKAARQDAGSITKTLASFHLDGSASSTVNSR